MTVTDQIEILNREIIQNEAQYDLDRKSAKISALSSNNLDKYEYLTGEDLGLKPNTIEQARFEYSPLGKIFNKGLDKDDKKEGLFKILENIENAQKGLINGNNKPDSARSKSSISSIFDSISSKSKDEDEDENEKTARELYQDGIEGMKGLKLPGEIESKDEKSQLYLENNLDKIKNKFSSVCDKYQRFFKHIVDGGKNDVDSEILSSNVNDINFYDRCGTLYEYLNHLLEFDMERISKRDKSFLKDLLKGFKIKKTYDTLIKNRDNVEKVYDYLVLKNKATHDVLYKNVYKVFEK